MIVTLRLTKNLCLFSAHRTLWNYPLPLTGTRITSLLWANPKTASSPGWHTLKSIRIHQLPSRLRTNLTTKFSQMLQSPINKGKILIYTVKHNEKVVELLILMTENNTPLHSNRSILWPHPVKLYFPRFSSPLWLCTLLLLLDILFSFRYLLEFCLFF